MQGPKTRPSLLLRLRDRSQHEAWQEFATIYEPLIYRLARRKGFQHADALDLSQEVFAAVERAIERFDPDPRQGSFRGWLFRIARNLMINFVARNHEPSGSGDSAVLRLLDQQPVVDEEAKTLFNLEYRREIFRCAARTVREEFREETWQSFWMTGVEGASIESVSRLLGKSPGAVRIARCRVLARLREEVRRFEQE